MNILIFTLLLTFINSRKSLLSDEVLEKIDLGYIDSTALCNDGTPAQYYWKKSSVKREKPQKWLIYLQGGGQCNDEASCQQRYANAINLMSSSKYKQTMSVNGVFSKSEDESPLWDANKAYLAYCSSDGHMGQLGGKNQADKKMWNFTFRGQANVRAMIRHLIQIQGLGQNSEDVVVFGGNSAGGRGAMVHLDQVSELLSQYGIKVLGLLDSPAYLDISPLYPEKLVGLNQNTQDVYNFFNVNHVMDNDCWIENFYDPWRCIFGQYRLKYIKTPFVLFADQYDSYQLGKLTNYSNYDLNPFSLSIAQQYFARNFAAFTKNFIQSFQFKQEKTNQTGFIGAIFSPSCGYHAVSVSNLFYKVKSLPTSSGIELSENDVLAEAMRQYFGKQILFGDERTFKVVDDCVGIACNCKKNKQTKFIF